MVEVKRLHLAELTVIGERWPVHGFVVTHPGGALLVDTGVGGSEQVLPTGGWSTAPQRTRSPTST